ncbi:MAG: AI-2E family transporter [bacterium]|nr:AI-2E family transporter [bacterium]
MSAKKKKSSSFTSLRIIGKKAQQILQSARVPNQDNRKSSKTTLPKGTEHEEFIMHLSVKSVVKAAFGILAIFIGTWMIAQLSDKIIILCLAMFVAAITDPGVQYLERLGVPRPLGVLIQYFVALFLLLFLVISLVPIIAQQLQEIALLISIKVDTFLANPRIDLPLLSNSTNQELTGFVQSTLSDLSIDKFTDALQQLGQNLSRAAQQSVRWAAQLAGSVVNFVVTMIVVLVLAFFMQLEKERIFKWFMGFFPQRYRMYARAKTEAIHSKIGMWARGQLLLCLSIFSLTLIALSILDMDYALTLAVLAGFCEFIPAVGPLIAAIPAVLIATTKGGFIWFLIVAGIYYLIQWCENNLLVPLIMRRAVGLSPIAILFAMMVGISFPTIIHPVLGIMLAIPTTTIIALFLEDWRALEGEEQ